MRADDHVGPVLGGVGRDEVGLQVGGDGLDRDRDAVGLGELVGHRLDGLQLQRVGPDDQVGVGVALGRSRFPRRRRTVPPRSPPRSAPGSSPPSSEPHPATRTSARIAGPIVRASLSMPRISSRSEGGCEARHTLAAALQDRNTPAKSFKMWRRSLRCCLVTIRLNEIAARAGVSVSTVSRVLNDRPGRQPAHPAAGAHRHRRARLRPPLAAQAALGRPGRPDHPRAGEPLLPALRAHGRERPVPPRLRAGAVQPDPRRRARGRLRADAPRARGLRDHLRLRHPRHRRQHSRPLPAAPRHGPADRAGQRRASGVSTPTSSRPTTRRSWSSGSPTSSTSATAGSGSRSGSSATRPCSAGREAFRRGLAQRGLVPDDLSVERARRVHRLHRRGRCRRRSAPARPRGDRDPLRLRRDGARRASGRPGSAGLRVPEDVSVVGSDDSLLVEFTAPP